MMSETPHLTCPSQRCSNIVYRGAQDNDMYSSHNRVCLGPRMLVKLCQHSSSGTGKTILFDSLHLLRSCCQLRARIASLTQPLFSDEPGYNHVLLASARRSCLFVFVNLRHGFQRLLPTYAQRWSTGCSRMISNANGVFVHVQCAEGNVFFVRDGVFLRELLSEVVLNFEPDLTTPHRRSIRISVDMSDNCDILRLSEMVRASTVTNVNELISSRFKFVHFRLRCPAKEVALHRQQSKRTRYKMP